MSTVKRDPNYLGELIAHTLDRPHMSVLIQEPLHFAEQLTLTVSHIAGLELEIGQLKAKAAASSPHIDRLDMVVIGHADEIMKLQGLKIVGHSRDSGYGWIGVENQMYAMGSFPDLKSALESIDKGRFTP